MRHLALLFAVGLIASCSHSVHQNSLAGFSPYRAATDGKLVTATVKSTVIFADFSDMENVDKCYQKLLDACPKGEIVGISTSYITSHGFFHWEEQIRMQGMCIRGNQT